MNRRGREASRNVITTLHRSNLLSIEEIVCNAPGKGPREAGFTERFHIVMPLSGSFSYSEGKRSLLAGANHLLLVPPKREYRLSHPVEGDRSLALFPRGETFAELEAQAGTTSSDTQVRIAGPEVRLAAVRLLDAVHKGEEALALDELSIELCRRIANSPSIASAAAASARTLDRAKQFLHANFREAISLADAAAAAGVSPVYLTQLFKRTLGMPLHQYLMSLRLTEAMHRLSGTDDITGLALDVGFSSHSHFSAAFRSRFGTTPSSVRSSYRWNDASVDWVTHPFPPRPLCAARGGGSDQD